MGCSGTGNSSSENSNSETEPFTLASCPVPCEGDVASSCEGEILVGECVNGERACIDCSMQNETCVFDRVQGTARCAIRNFVEVDCIPTCEGKTCGDDLCGGSCGFCPDEGICDGGNCLGAGMECDSTEESLRCIGEVLASCTNNALNFLDCAALGRVCGQNTTTGKVECLIP